MGGGSGNCVVWFVDMKNKRSPPCNCNQKDNIQFNLSLYKTEFTIIITKLIELITNELQGNLKIMNFS